MNILEKIMPGDKRDTALHAGEAYVLTTQLIARYDTLELLETMRLFVNDTDLMAIIDLGLSKTIIPHIEKLENEMKHYNIPFPPRPPEIKNTSVDKEVMRDEMIFRIIYSGTQAAINVHTKAIDICVNNSLRNLFLNFLNDDLGMQDSLIKYGKLKGWVRQMPQYKH